MPPSTKSVTPQEILQRLSAVLLPDLGESTNLLDITAVLVLKNLLKNLERYGSKGYLLLRIIVPCFVLLGGIYDIFERATLVQIAMHILVSYITAPLTARVFVPAMSSLK
jgi:hypothetical protein